MRGGGGGGGTSPGEGRGGLVCALSASMQRPGLAGGPGRDEGCLGAVVHRRRGRAAGRDSRPPKPCPAERAKGKVRGKGNGS